MTIFEINDNKVVAGGEVLGEIGESRIRVTINGENVTSRTFRASDTGGWVDVYVLDNEGRPQIHPLNPAIIWVNRLFGRVEVFRGEPIQVERLSDERLIELRDLYCLEIRPSCHLCGSQLTASSVGSSKSEWRCSGAQADLTGLHPTDRDYWRHYQHWNDSKITFQHSHRVEIALALEELIKIRGL